MGMTGQLRYQKLKMMMKEGKIVLNKEFEQKMKAQIRIQMGFFFLFLQSSV
uniref:NADH dehydrogenase subunit 3 n=1 Tax=Eleutherocaulis alte TaxID=74076 RepID=A0A1P7YWK8_9EUPU|nr:NADH dehydrogenase subunit 3 [Eleutherocaulis alte]